MSSVKHGVPLHPITLSDSPAGSGGEGADGLWWQEGRGPAHFELMGSSVLSHASLAAFS